VLFDFYTLSFYISGGTVEQIAFLRQIGVIAPLCGLLEANDPKTVLVVLDGLANTLTAAEKLGELEKVSLMIEECGGLDRIEDLQSHENIEIHHKALEILEQYFSTGVKNSILWLDVFSFISMITTTVHIQIVCADNLTIFLRFLKINFILKSLSLFRLIVFLFVFYFFNFDRGMKIPSWRNLHRRVAIRNSTTSHLKPGGFSF